MRLSYCTSNNAQHTLWLSPNMQACSFIKSLRVLQSVRSGGCTVVCQQAENDPLVAVGLLHLSIKQPELQAHLSVSQTESNNHRWKVCRLYCFSGWFVMEMLPQTEPNGPGRMLFIMSSLSRWLSRWALHFEWNESGCSSTVVNMESISAANSCFTRKPEGTGCFLLVTQKLSEWQREMKFLVVKRSQRSCIFQHLWKMWLHEVRMYL